MTTSTDTRIAYGARCTWWGPIAAAGTTHSGRLPGCPHCRGVLLEMPSEDAWWESVEDGITSGRVAEMLPELADPAEYRAFLRWLPNQRCFSTPEGQPDFHLAATAFAIDTGIALGNEDPGEAGPT